MPPANTLTGPPASTPFVTDPGQLAFNNPPSDFQVPNTQVQNAPSGNFLKQARKNVSGQGSKNKKGQRQADLLGPEFGRLVPEGGHIRNRDFPLLEIQLNAINQQKAEQDREFARAILSQQFGQVGQSPVLLQALASLQNRLQNPGVFSDQESATAQSAIRGRGAIGLEDALRAIQQNFGQRGLVGSIPSLADARLRQGTARDVGAGLQEQQIRELLLRDQKEQQATADLAAFGQSQQGQRLGIASNIADIFANTQRGQIDLGGGITPSGKDRSGPLKGTFDF